MTYPEPDRQCMVCGKWKHVRKFIQGTYVCRSCSRADEKRAKKKEGK